MSDKKRAWTKEPWYEGRHYVAWEQGKEVSIVQGLGAGRVRPRANMQRAVACVNALAGIENPAAWREAVGRLVAITKELSDEGVRMDFHEGESFARASPDKLIQLFHRMDKILALQSPREEPPDAD